MESRKILRRTLSEKFSKYFNILDRNFILLLAFLATALGIILFFVYRNFQQEKIRAFENESQFIVKLYGRMIEREIRSLRSSVREISKFSSLVEMGEDGKELVRNYYSSIGDGEISFSVIRIDENKKLVYSYPEEQIAGKKLLCKDLKKPPQKEFTAVSGLHEIFSGYKGVIITAPIFEGTGNFRGWIGVILDSSALARNYLGELQVRGVGRAWIVDSEGSLILSPSYSGKELKVSLLTEIRTSLLEELAAKKDGIAIYELIEKQKNSARILSFGRINVSEGNSWFICLDATLEEIQESLPRFEILERYFMIPVLIFILMSVILILVYRYFAKYYTMMLREQLLSSQKMEALGMFVNGLAHDFNNIIQLISGVSFLLKGNNGQATEKDISLLDDLSKKSDALTAQLVNFSRSIEIETDEIDLNRSISGTLEIVQYLLGNRIVLKTDVQPGIPKIIANPTQIEEIIINLCINAYDAMPSGGFLTVGSKVAEDKDVERYQLRKNTRYLKLSVVDTGTGIPEEIQKRIFDPFFSTKGEKGTGLGLATVQRIAESFGGAVKFETEKSKGTSFFVFFPVKEKQNK